MTIYHAAVTPDGYPDRMQSFASTSEQDVFKDIWEAVASRPWEKLWRFEADDSVVQTVQTALDEGDWKTAVREVSQLERSNIDGFRYRVGKTDLTDTGTADDDR